MIPMPSMLTIQKFYVSTIEHLEEISSTLGPNEVCFICQDDKARVPIGLTAANKQSPLLMHVEYRVSLPDHDWVVAACSTQVDPICVYWHCYTTKWSW